MNKVSNMLFFRNLIIVNHFDLQVLCQRPPDQCCANHHQKAASMAPTLSDPATGAGLRSLLTHSTTMAMMGTASASAVIDHDPQSKSHTLPSKFAAAAAAALQSGKMDEKQQKPLEAAATFIYPLNGRAMSAPRLPLTESSAASEAVVEDMREKYWGTYFMGLIFFCISSYQCTTGQKGKKLSF